MEHGARILLVDDEKNVLASLSRILRGKGFDVTAAQSGEEALAAVPGGGGAPPFDVVLADLKMPGMDGMKLLREMRARCAELPVVILTGYGTIRSAVEAMQGGAFEYLVKPASPEEILAVVERAARASRTGARAGAPGGELVPPIVGRSEALEAVLRLVERVAPLPFTVLIQGESGTGKELVARTIHARSARSRGPFVAVNCATVTPTLAESLFFGYRRGAFTGAEADRIGFFQAAAGGSLFLDEVGDLPEAVQGVLLRALQEGRVAPVGETRASAVDVRVISATNRDLEAEVREGRFRADLFYRLHVVQIQVPPLRERLEDVRALVDAFLAEYRAWFGFGPRAVADDVTARFLAHNWPGNVRELRNVIERAFAVTEGDTIEVRHLPGYLQGAPADVYGLSVLDTAERRQIQAALAATGGEKKAAAQLLGIDRKRLYRKLKRLGLYG
jgi:two-component system response regulator HydG